MSTDAGIVRHPLETYDRRRLYAETEATSDEEQAATQNGKKQRQKQYSQLAVRGKTDAGNQEKRSPEGGVSSDERSYEDAPKRAGRTFP